MRPSVSVLALGVLLLGGPLAHAAPICVDRHGEMRRCGAPDAMPVGWSPTPDQAAERLAGQSGGLGVRQWIGLSAFLAGLFALIALLPDFEGRWDGQETDKEDRGSRG